MKEKISLLFKDRNIRFFFIFTVVFLFFQLIILLFFFKNLPSEIPLYYSLPWGARQLAPGFMIFLFPFITLIFLLINIIISIFTFESDYFLSRFIFIFSFLTSFFSLFGLVNIILLMT